MSLWGIVHHHPKEPDVIDPKKEFDNVVAKLPPAPAPAPAPVAAPTHNIIPDYVHKAMNVITHKASPPTTPKAPQMTLLQHFGLVLRRALRIGVVVAEVASPAVAIEFPEVMPLFTSLLGHMTAAEATVVGPGTGAQKLAQVAAGFIPEAQDWAKANSISMTDAQMSEVISLFADAVNKLMAPTSATPPTA